GGGRAGAQLRQALVMVQFAVAVAFGIGTAIMVAQVAHLRAADMGFQREGLLIVSAIDDRALDPVHRRALLAAFAALPLVTSVTVADEAPSWLPAVASLPFTRPDAPLRKVSATIVPAGPGYFATYGARRLAGRLFDRVHGMDEPAVLTHRDGQLVSVNLILNQSAVRALGFAGPALAIGRSIRGGPFADARVIGVVADLRFTSPREPATPVVYAPGADDIGQNFAVRFTGPADAAASAIEKASRRVAPDLTIQTGTAAEYVEEGYRPDAQRARLFTIGAVLAVVIGCLGLYGLAAFDTARRVKEIGIRKTLGASTSDVLRLLIGQFMRPVLLANLLAWPLAFVAMRRWLSGFDDRVALSPLFFVGASLAAVLISAVTVVGQAWRVARAEPARALRHE
ncbi:FtsX-like permease family protein, partial [Sphingomonas bacterium]|uniref:FtsX-like permease family protein n=1 Tax=Sphingomonas bacterium TaxID=1895847 RepID=UPI0034A05F0C